VRRQVGDVGRAELRRDGVHDLVLAPAVLQRGQLGLEVTCLLPGQVGNRVTDTDAVGAVAGGADRCALRLPASWSAASAIETALEVRVNANRIRLRLFITILRWLLQGIVGLRATGLSG
jgi:hypothetical protein